MNASWEHFKPEISSNWRIILFLNVKIGVLCPPLTVKECYKTKKPWSCSSVSVWPKIEKCQLSSFFKLQPEVGLVDIFSSGGLGRQPPWPFHISTSSCFYTGLIVLQAKISVSVLRNLSESSSSDLPTKQWRTLRTLSSQWSHAYLICKFFNLRTSEACIWQEKSRTYNLCPRNKCWGSGLPLEWALQCIIFRLWLLASDERH